MGILIKIFKRVGLGLIVLLTLLYFLAPPVASLFVDKEFKSKFKTQMSLSDQPKRIKLTSSEKVIHRALNLDTYFGIVSSTIWHFPSLIINYFSLPTKYPKIEKDSFGVFVDSSKASIKEILDSLKDLNIKSVAMRIYITDRYLNSSQYKKSLDLAQKLKENGYSLMVVLAQLNETFNDNYQLLLKRVISDFSSYTDYYQTGVAINRDKWGVFNKDRFQSYIIAIYQAIKSNDPKAKIIGPSVIDFEWYYTIYYLNLVEDFIDIQGALLYVDRVGQPENTQYGFDTIDKVRLLKAINKDKPLWITEVNWPIKDTKSYKPTSNKEAVSLDKYRDYMLRYLIEVLSTGYVERVYWWQLYAKGYGLIDHLSKKRYPAFEAYKELIALLSDSTLIKKEFKDNQFKYSFKKDKNRFYLMWSIDEESKPTPKNLKCKSINAFLYEKLIRKISWVL